METYEDRLEAALIVQLRVELAERDMTQQDLAKELGVPAATLNRYMKGHRSIPMPTFFRIAQILGTDPQSLMARAVARL